MSVVASIIDEARQGMDSLSKVEIKKIGRATNTVARELAHGAMCCKESVVAVETSHHGSRPVKEITCNATTPPIGVNCTVPLFTIFPTRLFYPRFQGRLVLALSTEPESYALVHRQPPPSASSICSRPPFLPLRRRPRSRPPPVSSSPPTTALASPPPPLSIPWRGTTKSHLQHKPLSKIPMYRGAGGEASVLASMAAPARQKVRVRRQGDGSTARRRCGRPANPAVLGVCSTCGESVQAPRVAPTPAVPPRRRSPSRPTSTPTAAAERAVCGEGQKGRRLTTWTCSRRSSSSPSSRETSSSSTMTAPCTAKDKHAAGA